MQDPAQHPRAAELLSGEARSRPGGHRRALTAAAAEPDRMQGRNHATHQGHWIQPDAPGSRSTTGSVSSSGRHVHTGSTSMPTLPFLPLLSAAAPHLPLLRPPLITQSFAPDTPMNLRPNFSGEKCQPRIWNRFLTLILYIQ